MGAKQEYEARKAAEATRQAKKQQAPEKRYWWFNSPDPVAKFTGWVAIYTLMLFVATVISAVILYKTDETLHQTLILTQRPWVTIETSIAGPFVYGDGGVSIKLTVTLKNTGLTPALSVMPYAGFPRLVEGRRAFEIIRDNCQEGGGLQLAVGYGQGPTLFPGAIMSEIKIPYAAKSYVDSHRVSPFFYPEILVCTHYKFAIKDDEVHRSGVLYRVRHPHPSDERMGAPINLDLSPIAPDTLRLYQMGADAN